MLVFQTQFDSKANSVTGLPKKPITRFFTAQQCRMSQM